MRNKLLYAIVLVLIVVLVGFIITHHTDVPSSFTAQLVTNNTSSGANRTTRAELTYKNSVLIQGTAHYIADTNSGEHIEYSCRYQGNTWTDTETGAVCSTLPPYPISRTEFKNQIREGKLLPAGEKCTHTATCYTIE